MYSLPTLQLNVCTSFRRKSLSSPTCRHYQSWEHRQYSRLVWKMGSTKQDIPNMTYHIPRIAMSNNARQGGRVNVLQNDHSESQVVDEAVGHPEKSKIDESIEYVKNMLGSMDDGRISVSPYDTAWVALIRDIQGRDIPQFPTSLDWISNNQLSDGSWGEESYFLAYDRIICTLACVVALRYWNVHAHKTEKGILFIKENISMLGDANIEHRTCGFEFVFPALLQRAKELGIDGIPYDAPVIKQIFDARDRKMKRVPKELFYKVPTCLLYNLEGLGNVEALGKLDWPKLLKLQTPKGTFLTSSASAAFAVIETKDEDCLKFIEYIVDKFDGGAPTCYPVDIYARLWAVDRIQRLGVSRFFDPQIKNCLDHVYRFWSEKGVFSARECEFCDIDDTSMGFRLLRLHGYNIGPNALTNFKNNNNGFTCYVGQEFESPSPIFNLYRASQVLFPGETILEEANEFSYSFLQQRIEKNDLLDKWLISKHLPDEIKNGMEMPWYATLPRVEARFYIENYGVDDVWIGKALYRMPDINDGVYLELAKLDYNRCQAEHKIEWDHMQQWYEDSTLDKMGISKKELLLAFFLATASIFEPEKSTQRIAWAKTRIICNIVSSYYLVVEGDQSSKQSIELPRDFSNKQDKIRGHNEQRIITFLLETLRELCTYARERNATDITDLLLDVWGVWLKKFGQGEEDFEEVELLIGTLNICGGHIYTKNILSLNEYKALSRHTAKICRKLQDFESGRAKVISSESKKMRNIMHEDVEKDMQLLVQLVLKDDPIGLSKDIKQTFLHVAKTYYYRAYFSTEKIDYHISKVLFEKIV